MDKRFFTANILLTTGLCCLSGHAHAEAAAVADVTACNATTTNTYSLMKDIKAAIPEQALKDYTAKDILALWRMLQPEIADEIVNKYGEDTVLAFIDLVLNYANSGILPSTLPDISEIINSETIQKYAEEIKILLGQVVPLYTYLMKDRHQPMPADASLFSVKEVYTTPKDGCFYGIGDERNTYDPFGIDCDECKANGGKPKANGSYAWSMVSDGKKLYWGTNNNYICMPSYNPITTGGNGPVENSCWVCEYEKGLRSNELAETDPSLAKYGDFMQPRIFSYDPRTGVVTDITPEDGSLKFCQGVRSAACHKGVVFFGGPNFTGGADSQQSSSATFLAYSPEKGKFIGSSSLSSVSGCTITNVRRWIVIDDVLYCGVGLIKDGVAGGGIMRWNGSVDDPFNFEIVGYTPAEAAEIEYHNGHIYIGGWPIAKAWQAMQTASALYKSPEVPKGGFTAANATTWPKVWEYTAYETNPTAYGNTYFSVMKSFKGRLYWGMFSGTYSTIYLALRRFGTLKSAEAIAYILGSMRATTLFSAEELDGDNSKVELLYGESKLPVYDATTKTWSLAENGSGYKPIWGRSGYGNLFTCYTWAMSEYNDKLFVGTMDMSNLVDPNIESMTQYSKDNDEAAILIRTLKKLLNVNSQEYGYECLMLSDNDTEPELVTANGFGNPAAYGIRNMEVCDNKMFIGTANPLNLHEQGGWQILSLEEDNTTSVGAAPVKKAGILFKQNDHYLEFSSMTGEKIQSVTMTDLSGKPAVSANYGRTLATVVTDGMPKGIYVASIKTQSDCYSMKITLK